MDQGTRIDGVARVSHGLWWVTDAFPTQAPLKPVTNLSQTCHKPVTNLSQTCHVSASLRSSLPSYRKDVITNVSSTRERKSEGQTGAIAPSLDTSCTKRTANKICQKISLSKSVSKKYPSKIRQNLL